MTISFEGSGQIKPEDLRLQGWVSLELDADLRGYVDLWVRTHECSCPAHSRHFRVALGTMQVDHWVELKCLACGTEIQTFAGDVEAGEPLPPLERPIEPRSVRVTGRDRARPQNVRWTYLPTPVRWKPEMEAWFERMLGEPVEMSDVARLDGPYPPFTVTSIDLSPREPGEYQWGEPSKYGPSFMDWDALFPLEEILTVEKADWESWEEERVT